MTDHASKPPEAVQTSKVATIAAAHAVHDAPTPASAEKNVLRASPSDAAIAVKRP